MQHILDQEVILYQNNKSRVAFWEMRFILSILPVYLPAEVIPLQQNGRRQTERQKESLPFAVICFVCLFATIIL